MESAILLPPNTRSLADVASEVERHLVFARGTARLRLCIRLAPCRPIPTFSILCDSAGTQRLAAAVRLQRVIGGNRSAAEQAALPTAYQRARYVQLLRVNDALEAGVSSRELAFGLIFPNHRPLLGAMWKGSSERRHVLRLIASARNLASTGYQSLLQHR